MDPLESGMRYNPKSQENDWETSVQFLPASNSKKLEKRGPGRKVTAFAIVVLLAILLLVAGFLVWHFIFRYAGRVSTMFSGSMRITNQEFKGYYEDSNSTEFHNLAKQVTDQLKLFYSRAPQVVKYYRGSTVQAFSEGPDSKTVIAYYLSEFNVPSDKADALNEGIYSLSKTQNEQKPKSRRLGSLVFDSVTSGAMDARMMKTSLKQRYQYRHHCSKDQVVTLQSPGFPNNPYPSNTYADWMLRGDPNHRLKLEFNTFSLENDCGKDFMRVYGSLVPIEKEVMAEKCGHYAPGEPLSFISSGNVMLLTLITNELRNFPGFQAKLTQIPQTIVCGGKLTGFRGNFSSPNYPSYYPTQTKCTWDIEVPQGKFVKVEFSKFLMSEPGQNYSVCKKDYVKVNTTTLCGEKPPGTVVSVQSNKITVVFSSDKSYVDRGFSAEFQAFDPTDPCPGKFQCQNNDCIESSLRCDGYSDCLDDSDEMNCKCDATYIKCRNGLCKPKLWQCNGVDDCGDNTDELDCGCKPEEFTCKNGKCLSEKNKCDDKDDCGDGSDELQCSRASMIACSDLTFKCKNNVCISKQNAECDGENDCADGSDEANCDCGTRAFKKSRIVGGQAAMPGEWPWQVSLHIKGNGHVCGASVINNQWLVTAAHCVQNDANVKYSQPQVWEAYLGLHVQGQFGDMTVKRNLKRIIPHPYYNEYTYDNDIALMELDTPVTLNPNIKPICLPADTHDFPVGMDVWVTGWGATLEGGFASSILQKADVRVINGTICNQLMTGQITARMMCAGVITGGVDACQGDSGGPLSAENDNGRWFLAGVVSWGDGCARRNKPGIYTRITKFRGWIREKTGV